MKRFPTVLASIALVLVFVASAAIPVQAEEDSFEEAHFSNPLDIDNPYFPLVPGTTFIYEGTSDGKPIYEEFVVTDQTKTILGVETRVVRDTNWEKGKLVEKTFDWFAQDDAGNVWYFGEFATEYKNGKVIGHEGSWEAGVDGASAGIVMLADPEVGDTYQQENAPGVAEDMATVLSLDESICVPVDCFSDVLKTKDFTPLEPDVVEHKYYAPGIGQIKTIMVAGGSEVSKLVDIVTDDGDGDEGEGEEDDSELLSLLQGQISVKSTNFSNTSNFSLAGFRPEVGDPDGFTQQCPCLPSRGVQQRFGMGSRIR
jgi:hypothetical protein